MQDMYSREWIKSVRNGMSQEKFCKHIFIYRENGRVCDSVHRNSIGNWETGKTALPRDVETFLSYALWEYDHRSETENADMAELDETALRNCRYQYARERMLQMLHVDLYCRNLHDALLIQVTRGVLSFKAVTKLERELEAKLEQVNLSREEQNEYAIERNTISISSDLCRVNSISELVNLITVIHRNSFASANRIVGARFKKVYESKSRYTKQVSLERAIVNLAPNYRNSYVRMFTSSFISREWLIDLSTHLRFEREEINTMLEAAHMAKLEEEEFCVDFNAKFAQKSVLEKMKILLILGGYINSMKDTCSITAYPPASRLLETFSLYESGKNLLAGMDKLLAKEIKRKKTIDAMEFNEIWGKFELLDMYDLWLSGIEILDASTSFDEELNAICIKENSAYTDIKKQCCEAVTSLDVFGNIYFYTAMAYSVLLERKFSGKLTHQDLLDLKRLFNIEDDIEKFIYLFLSTLFGIFLGDNPICETSDGKYYVYNQVSQKNTRKLNMEETLENIFQAVVALMEPEAF